MLQNKARGKSGRTRPEVEERVIEIYRESFEPGRPQGRRYSAAKVARLLKKRRNIQVCRKTVWSALRRRGVWEPDGGQKKAVQRFERAKPNELWQGVGTTQFEEMLKALGIQLRIAPRAQTKGKEERINQFIERDFLDEVHWQVTSLADLNQRADDWLGDYNHTHPHETIRCTPAHRYQPGLQVDPQFLRQLCAAEERRKVTREAKVRFHNHHFKVPEKYIGWSVWVANFFDQSIEIRAGSKTIAIYQL